MRIEQKQALREINTVYAAVRGKELREVEVVPLAFGKKVGKRLAEREDDLLFPRCPRSPAKRYAFARVGRGTRPETNYHGCGNLLRLNPGEKRRPTRVSGLEREPVRS
jgi:hypothetical protein